MPGVQMGLEKKHQGLPSIFRLGIRRHGQTPILTSCAQQRAMSTRYRGGQRQFRFAGGPGLHRATVREQGGWPASNLGHNCIWHNKTRLTWKSLIAPVMVEPTATLQAS